MVLGSWRQRAGVVLTFVAVVLLWGAAQAPAHGESLGGAAGQVIESAEADAAGGGSPSTIAGLSLLGAAVTGTLWNVAMAERRRQRHDRN